MISKALFLKLHMKSTLVMDFRKSGYMVSTEVLQFKSSKIAHKFNIIVTEFKADYRRVLLAAFNS